MLDEPTNNLDRAGVRQLTSALESYEGALLIAGHDLPFLESIGITRWLLMGEELLDTTADDVLDLLAVTETNGAGLADLDRRQSRGAW